MLDIRDSVPTPQAWISYKTSGLLDLATEKNPTAAIRASVKSDKADRLHRLLRTAVGLRFGNCATARGANWDR